MKILCQPAGKVSTSFLRRECLRNLTGGSQLDNSGLAAAVGLSGVRGGNGLTGTFRRGGPIGAGGTPGGRRTRRRRQVPEQGDDLVAGLRERPGHLIGPAA